MTTTTNNKKPNFIYRDGPLKAAVWWNSVEAHYRGGFHTVKFTRTWKDEQGVYHDSERFSGTDLLRLANLAAHIHSTLNVVALDGTDKYAVSDAQASADIE